MAVWGEHPDAFHAGAKVHSFASRSVFDTRQREDSNLLEAQQMLYVAVTRPSKRLIGVGQGFV